MFVYLQYAQKCLKTDKKCVKYNTVQILTDTKQVAAGTKYATFSKAFNYAGTFLITATTSFTDSTVWDRVAATSVNVYPKLSFDNNVKGTVKLGATSKLTVWIDPAIAPKDYSSNEIVAFDPGGSVKIITGTNIITKTSGKTGVYTSYVFTKPGIYTPTATYQSGIYAAVPAKATTKITVEDVKLTLTPSANTGKPGDVITLTATVDSPIAANVNFSTTGFSATVPLKNQKAEKAWTLPAATKITTYEVLAKLDSSKFTSNASAKATVVVAPTLPDAIELTYSPTSGIVPVKGTFVFTATIKQGGQVMKKAGEAINFTTTRGDLALGLAATQVQINTNPNGQAVVKLSSTEVGTATVTAQDATVPSVSAKQEVEFLNTCGAEGTYILSNDYSLKLTGTLSVTGLTNPFCVVVDNIASPGALPAGVTGYAYSDLTFYNLVNGVCTPVENKDVTFHSDVEFITKFNLQASLAATVPFTNPGQIKIASFGADNTWTLLPSTATSTGTVGQVSAQLDTPGDAFALVSSLNKLYLPTISK